MRQVAAGEIGGLETLYDRYHAVAYALALRITTETGLAEDVVQDSFLGLWRNAGRYAEDKGSVKGWLLAIVRHRAIDSMRRRRNGVTIGDETEDLLPAALTLPDIWPEVAGRLDAQKIQAGAGEAAGGAARRDRAGLLRRPDAAGDSHPDRCPAWHGQEQDAARPGLPAARTD